MEFIQFNSIVVWSWSCFLFLFLKKKKAPFYVNMKMLLLLLDDVVGVDVAVVTTAAGRNKLKTNGWSKAFIWIILVNLSSNLINNCITSGW